MSQSLIAPVSEFRCPFVMDECRQKHPPLYRTNADRAVACYLYKEEGATVTGQEMADALAAQTTAQTTAA